MDGRPLIYLVEDDADVRMSLMALFTTVGFATESFESAEEFLAAFSKSDGACLVSDIRLGGLSGIELLELLRMQQISLPVILISAHLDAKTISRAVEAGAAAVIDKPCQANALIRAIRRELPVASSQ